jgi:transmembrane sensor
MTPASSRPPSAPDAALRAAGAWLARRDRGFRAGEAAAFEHWRAADPRHAAAVAELERTMDTFDGLRAFAPENAADRAPDPDFFAPARPRTPRRAAVFGAVALAAAAALAVLFVRFDPPAPAAPAPRLVTGAGATERTTLPDGTVATLNEHTRLVLEFTGAERRVRLLRGEAHFEVTKDPARPFVVAAGTVAARAVGTAFNVRLGAEAVEVLVTAGRVQVARDRAQGQAAPEAAVLSAGFRATVALAAPTAAPHVVQLETDDIARRLAWQPRLRELSNASLADIVANFNRQASGPASVRLVLGEPGLADLRIGGSIYFEQPDAFVRLLEKSFGLRAERAGDTLVLRRAPAP